MEELILRKGIIIDGNVVKCLLFLKDGSEVIGVADREEIAYEEALKKLEFLPLRNE